MPEPQIELRYQYPHLFRADPVRLWRRRIIGGIVFATFIWCLYDFDATPARLWNGLQRLGQILSFMFPPHVWSSWSDFAPYARGLLETLVMAFLGTVLAMVIALPLSLLGAENLNRFRILRFGIRRGFDMLRAFETLLIALILIRAFGLGPLAGVLAIAISDIGGFAKLYAEAIENTSKKPVEGVVSAGGGPLQSVLFGIFPQVMPVILSITLYQFESNVRSGTILGIVGAGGIGYLLSQNMGMYRWDVAWSIIILLIIMVYIVDTISGRLRSRLSEIK